MPSSKHLEWADITDFTPGFFDTSGDLLMPATAAQTMTDCHPEPGGGLRAAGKPTSFSTTGLGATGERVIGVYSRGAIALRAGVGDASDRYVWTYKSSDNKVRVYRWDETDADTAWTEIKVHAAVSATPNPVIADTFVDSAGDAYVVYTLAQTGSDDGLWSIKYSDGTVTKQLGSIFPLAVCVQDDRIITGNLYTLRWNDSQSISSFPAPNNLPVQASRQGNNIQALVAFAPTDLFVGTRFSAWSMVQGSITDPTVRTMSDAYTVGWPQNLPFTESGFAFISPNQGVMLSSDGQSFSDISSTLDRTRWVQGSTSAIGDVGGGNLSYIAPYLVAPHGLFFDFRTKSWHQSSVLLANDAFHSFADRNYRQLFVATGGQGYSLYVFDAKESSRWNTYTWRSAPLRHPSGRQIRVREIEVYCKAYDSASTIEVTVNGTARTVTMTASGKQQLDFLFDESDEMLDIKVVASSASAGVEAPSIEVVRVGTLPAHRLK